MELRNVNNAQHPAKSVPDPTSVQLVTLKCITCFTRLMATANVMRRVAGKQALTSLVFLAEALMHGNATAGTIS